MLFAAEAKKGRVLKFCLLSLTLVRNAVSFFLAKIYDLFYFFTSVLVLRAPVFCYSCGKLKDCLQVAGIYEETTYSN
ncbi:MAG: hypothetical protein AYK18_16635 [Theionarchaea archaeon DG-70]|nr:MAG: hypothetical protein AYK18_16635 [Theionarchaea archaeon DG-70]